MAGTDNKSTIYPYIRDLHPDKVFISTFLTQVYSPGPIFQCILDYRTNTYLLVSDSISTILGEDPLDFTPDDLFNRIHPRDRNHFRRSKESGQLFLMNRICRDEVQFYKIAFQYRLKNSSEYKLFLHQEMAIEWNREGAILRSFKIVSDINHICSSNNRNVSLIGLAGKPSYYGIGSRAYKEESDSDLPEFTRREKEVLRYLAEGFSTEKIAKHLSISEGTVRTHRRNIMAKAKNKNTIQIVAMALQEGVI